MRIVLDTNALMMPVESGIRLFDELDRLLGPGAYEPVVPRAVVAELEELSGSHGTEATAASVGRDLVDRCTTVETTAEYADDAVIEVATGDPGAAYAVTNDRPLRRRLLERNVPVICLRGRAKLGVTDPRAGS